MSKPATFPLVAENDDGIRPAGSPDQCFSYQRFVGQPHGPDCVVVSKRVRLRYIVEIDADIPRIAIAKAWGN